MERRGGERRKEEQRESGEEQSREESHGRISEILPLHCTLWRGGWGGTNGPWLGVTPQSDLQVASGPNTDLTLFSQGRLNPQQLSKYFLQKPGAFARSENRAMFFINI